ncbi:TonB-dependent receptor plug domain-containing protein [Undibacterium flavidum]|uniref:TonB-dependent receptor n=1 Tax=Undibacterium flavidum TaxID=2762297 RepID=A0ABR6Y8J0_9BURK|nr:TonB-dependent receptor [Undibacterium flavidum]MBC3872901.1 TonB-dependent receptor [Undibacterium flavidum]
MSLESFLAYARSKVTYFIAFNILNGAVMDCAWAQENPGSTTSNSKAQVKQIEQIEINGSTKKYDPRRDDTATKFVVTKEEIEKYGDTNVIDILNRQPGITNGNLNGIRGYTQYLLDGQSPPRNFRLEDIQLSQVERIEIIRSAVAEFSTQGIGGTINIVLKRQIKAANRKLQLALTHQDESGFSKRMNLSIANKFDDMSYDIYAFTTKTRFGRLNLTEIEKDDSKEDLHLFQTLRRQTATDNWIYSLNPSFNWKLTDEDSLSLKSRITELTSNSGTQGKRQSYDLPTNSLQQEDELSTWKPSVQYLETSWIKQLGEKTKLTNTVSVYRASINSESQMAISNVQRQSRQSISKILERHKNVLWNGNFSHDFSSTQTFKSGWNLESRDSTSLESQESLLKSHTKIRTQNMAFFAQDEWNESDIWSHYLGLRWEAFRSKLDNEQGQQLNKIATILSPIVQTRWKNPSNKENQFRLALARTFKSPEAIQMITTTLPHFNNDLTSPDTIGNPNLRPEIAWGLDSAFEHFGENGFNYSISHYLKQVKHLLRDRLFQSNELWLQQTINDGNALAQSLVFDTSFPISIVFNNAPNMNIKANMSRNWSTVNNVSGPNNRFAEQAKFNANLNLDYKFNDAWKMGANYGVVSGGPLRVAQDRINLVQVRRTTSAYAHWAINKESTLRMSASNLLLEPVRTQSSIFNQQEKTTVRSESRGVLFTNVNLEIKF